MAIFSQSIKSPLSSQAFGLGGTRHDLTPRCGAWRLGSVLFQGRWSTIYRARPLDCDEPSAWDYVLKTARADDELARGMLLREWQVSRTVSHPHLTAALAGELEGSTPHVVFPYIRGGSVRQILDLCGPPPLAHTLWIVRQTVEALAALHRQGWLHGDVKPDNILVAPDGHATLVDLGLARSLDQENRGGHPMSGSPSYMPPEFLNGENQWDEGSDIYSLGVTLFEMLTGHPPFDCRDAARLAQAHLQQSPPELTELLPHISDNLGELTRRMLSKDSGQRPQSDAVIERLVALEIEMLCSRLSG